jgi:hypothetical protein
VSSRLNSLPFNLVKVTKEVNEGSERKALVEEYRKMKLPGSLFPDKELRPYEGYWADVKEPGLKLYIPTPP